MISNKIKVSLISVILSVILTNQTVSSLAATADSTYTPQVEQLLTLVLFISIMIATLVFGLLLYILIRFREGTDTVRKHIKNEMRLEVAWIAFATIIVTVLFAVSLPVTSSYFTEQEIYDEEILVIAYQFNFTFVRENGSRTVDVVYLDLHKNYKFNITSIDVIHSFYAHELSIKLDMVPGRYNIVYVQVHTPGTYEVRCAEYCGFGHYLMEAKIIVR
jgi:heme/copper-type cytochrome/quinol oxidase subunit 2